jgi:hypothetical protein
MLFYGQNGASGPTRPQSAPAFNTDRVCIHSTRSIAGWDRRHDNRPLMKLTLDFAHQTVLVVGGSSGIGNGVANTFRGLGATVYVWGTRQHASDYADEAASHLDGLNYQQLDVTDDVSVANYQPPFRNLDVLVLSQGVVPYGRAEFELEGFRGSLL